jgi:hypothetical protein
MMCRRAPAWALVAALTALLAVHQPAAGQTGITGRLEVKQVETGFRLGSDALRLRVHLVNGQAVEYDTRDAAEIERVLDLVGVFAAPGRSRLFAEVEGNLLKGLQVSVP